VKLQLVFCIVVGFGP